MSDVTEKIWQNLISCIQETSNQEDDIYTLLASRPVFNEFSRHKDICSCTDGRLKECAPCPLDDFILYLHAGGRGKINECYLGFADRILDQDSAKVSYVPEAFAQLKHETGLRLLRLYETGRDVYFTSELLGYKAEKVTKEIIDNLLDSDKSRKLGLVRIDLLKKLGIE